MEITKGDKWRQEQPRAGQNGDHEGRQMKGDWGGSGRDFGDQQPNLWEVRTPIASSYLVKNELLDSYIMFCLFCVCIIYVGLIFENSRIQCSKHIDLREKNFSQVSTEQTLSYPVASGRSALRTGKVSSKLVVETSHVTSVFSGWIWQHDLASGQSEAWALSSKPMWSLFLETTKFGLFGKAVSFSHVKHLWSLQEPSWAATTMSANRFTVKGTSEPLVQ